jgi:ribosomal-protein-alanine N-acetyltransferase
MKWNRFTSENHRRNESWKKDSQEKKRMMGLEIVEAHAGHLDDIMVVENLCFKIPWSKESIEEEILHNGMAVYLTAVAKGHAVGYAGMWKVFDEGHITNIAVHPEFRKDGVGSELLSGLIERGRKSGITALTLEVRKSNTAARALYTKFGFIDGGLRKAYYADNNEDAIIMWRREEQT